MAKTVLGTGAIVLALMSGACVTQRQPVDEAGAINARAQAQFEEEQRKEPQRRAAAEAQEREDAEDQRVFMEKRRHSACYEGTPPSGSRVWRSEECSDALWYCRTLPGLTDKLMQRTVDEKCSEKRATQQAWRDHDLGTRDARGQH